MDKSKRQLRIEKKAQEKRKNQMKWVAIIAALAVLLAVFLIVASQVKDPEIDHVYTQKNGISLGNPNAPVRVIEYGDFQCSHCRNFYATTESQLINTYVDSGQVLFTYFALDFLGPESARSAAAAYCAADQNMFWEYHDIVFANYSTSNSGGYSDARLTEFATSLTMDIDQFNACFNGADGSDMVTTAREESTVVGVTGTPSFLINGKLRGGNLPWEELVAEIEAALGN